MGGMAAFIPNRQGDPELKGLSKIKKVNQDANKGVRRVMTDAGTFPETIAPVEDVKVIQARLDKQRAKLVRKNEVIGDA